MFKLCPTNLVCTQGCMWPSLHLLKYNVIVPCNCCKIFYNLLKNYSIYLEHIRLCLLWATRWWYSHIYFMWLHIHFLHIFFISFKKFINVFEIIYFKDVKNVTSTAYNGHVTCFMSLKFNYMCMYFCMSWKLNGENLVFFQPLLVARGTWYNLLIYIYKCVV